MAAVARINEEEFMEQFLKERIITYIDKNQLKELKNLSLIYTPSFLQKVVNLPIINDTDPRTSPDSYIKRSYDKFKQKKLKENKVKLLNGEEQLLEDLTNENNNIESFKESLTFGENTLLHLLFTQNVQTVFHDMMTRTAERRQKYPHIVPPSAEELKFKEMAKCLMSYGARLEPDTELFLFKLNVLGDYLEDIYPSKIALLATVPVDHSRRVRHVLHHPLHKSRNLPDNNRFLDLFELPGEQDVLFDYLEKGLKTNPKIREEMVKGFKGNKKSKRKTSTGKNYSKK